jgi:hypothetical protein
VLICSFFLHKAFGLKKIKVFRDGSVQELSYDEDGNEKTETISDSDDRNAEDDSNEDEDSDEEAPEDTEDHDEAD